MRRKLDEELDDFRFSPGNGQWHAIKVMSNHEKAIELVLHVCRGFDVYCPHSRRTVIRKRNNRPGGKPWRTVIESPLFPGYSFARFNWEEHRAQVLAAPGVLAIVQNSPMQARPLTDAEMDEIRKLEALGAQPAELKLGGKVRILEGAMSGMSGVLIRRNDQSLYLSVTVAMLGRTVEVPLVIDEQFVEVAA